MIGMIGMGCDWDDYLVKCGYLGVYDGLSGSEMLIHNMGLAVRPKFLGIKGK